MKKIIIAIDGHSSCGKSTMAKDLAKAIGYIYVDTGAMYRAVTLYALRHGMIDQDGNIDSKALENDMEKISISFKLNSDTNRPDTWLNGTCVESEIRTMEVSNNVSAVSALGFVRAALVRQQQAMGEGKGIVMDGRDIGTMVFPQAELKIFVTASPEVRARRRYDELERKGTPAPFEEVLENVLQRDYADSHRDISPLRKADDAITLDNSDMTIAQQNEWLLRLYHETVKE